VATFEQAAPLIAHENDVQTPEHGTVTLAPSQVGRDAGRIADEVVTHVVGLIGWRSKRRFPREIPTRSCGPSLRNSRTLKFASNSGFEME
jgi:hypothetical protein